MDFYHGCLEDYRNTWILFSRVKVQDEKVKFNAFINLVTRVKSHGSAKVRIDVILKDFEKLAYKNEV
jgi:hypothetical protein